MTTALASLLSRRLVRADVAMTGRARVRAPGPHRAVGRDAREALDLAFESATTAEAAARRWARLDGKRASGDSFL
jgi:hypothetical protein